MDYFVFDLGFFFLFVLLSVCFLLVSPVQIFDCHLHQTELCMYATTELEMVLVLHHCIILLEAAVRKFVHCGRKGHGQQ